MQSQTSITKDRYEHPFRFLMLVITGGIIFLLFSIYINDYIDINLSANTYLIFHIFIELTSAIIALCIFIVLYFTYDIFYRRYALIIANTFFIVGVLDIFHLFTYKGMYNLFPENLQTPTYFWIFSRVILGLGLFLAYMTKKETISSLSKGYSLIISISIILFSIYLSVIFIDEMPLLLVLGQGLTNTKIYTEYAITAIFLVDIFIYAKRNYKDMDMPHTYMLSGIVLGVFVEICFMLYVNVYGTLNIAGHILKIISYGFIFRAVFVKNVRRPYQKIYEQKEMLTIDIDDLHIAMEEKTAEIYKQNKILEDINYKMKDDLDSTSVIQQAMFPNTEETINGLKFNAKVMPCDHLSGDYINYFNIDDNNVGFYIMDVSGHGVAAAMLGVFAAQSIGDSMRIKYKEASVFSPASVLNHFYTLFNQSGFPDEMHIVMLYGMYNMENGKVTLSSAGLNCKPIFISQEGRTTFVDIDSGFPICKLGDVFEPEFIDYEMDLKSGEKLILYTDGLTEMRKNSGEFWGADSFLAYIQFIGANNSVDLKDKIKAQVEENISKSEQDDDITFCVIEKI